ncbi:alpha/beta fold hydrolase [Rhodococcus opacus]|uniref:alpha/beta fold hydrolase n=1 Tax=Rhodococcus opacus TaxID=37919 RepID=UPI00384F194A
MFVLYLTRNAWRSVRVTFRRSAGAQTSRLQKTTKENAVVPELPAAQFYRTSLAHIAYRDLGSGPTLLLLHGAAPGETGWDSFAASIEVLRTRFRVIVPDQPGFGQSPLVEDNGLPYNAISAKAMAELLRHLGTGRVHVSGNSLGGGVALRLALEYPGLVDRIILVAPSVRGFCPRFLAPPPRRGLRFSTTTFPARHQTRCDTCSAGWWGT